MRCDTKAIENPFKKSLVKTRCGSDEKARERRIFVGAGVRPSTKERDSKGSDERNHEIQILLRDATFHRLHRRRASQGFNFKLVGNLKSSGDEDDIVFV